MDTAWESQGRWMEKIACCLPYLDWFMPSFDEAERLAGERDPQKIAAAFREKGVGNTVIKLGGDGCYVAPQNGEGFFVKAIKTAVVDTSGAGDSFCAGFLTGLSKGWPLEKCARFANAVGSLCVSAIGTTAGVRNMTDTLKYMEKNGG
jgi:sugar/nucleoside kinase (ribokinase family)